MSPSTIPGPPPAPARPRDASSAPQQDVGGAGDPAPEGFANLLGQVSAKPGQPGPEDSSAKTGDDKSAPADGRAATDAQLPPDGAITGVPSIGTPAALAAGEHGHRAAPSGSKGGTPAPATDAIPASSRTSSAPSTRVTLHAKSAAPGGTAVVIDPAKATPTAPTAPSTAQAAKVAGQAAESAAPRAANAPGSNTAAAASAEALASVHSGEAERVTRGPRAQMSGRLPGKAARPAGAKSAAPHSVSAPASGRKQAQPAQTGNPDQDGPEERAGSAPATRHGAQPQALLDRPAQATVRGQGRGVPAGQPKPTATSQPSAASQPTEETQAASSAFTRAPRSPAGVEGTVRPHTLVRPLSDTITGLVRVASRGGVATARITLTPPELGSVEIKLRVRGSTVIAELSADSSQGAQALGQSVADLKRSLEAQGFVVQDLDVRQSGPDGGAGSRQGGNGASGQGQGPEADLTDEETQVEVAVAAGTAAGEQVDVLA